MAEKLNISQYDTDVKHILEKEWQFEILFPFCLFSFQMSCNQYVTGNTDSNSKYRYLSIQFKLLPKAKKRTSSL